MCTHMLGVVCLYVVCIMFMYFSVPICIYSMYVCILLLRVYMLCMCSCVFHVCLYVFICSRACVCVLFMYMYMCVCVCVYMCVIVFLTLLSSTLPIKTSLDLAIFHYNNLLEGEFLEERVKLFKGSSYTLLDSFSKC